MGRTKTITWQNLFLALATLVLLVSVAYFFVENEVIIIEEIENAFPGLNGTIKKWLGILITSIFS